MAKKSSRSQRKDSRVRASRGAMRSGLDDRRPPTPVPSSADERDGRAEGEGERASAAAARAEARRRRRREEERASATRSFSPVRADDPVAPPIARGPAARSERRTRALWGFLALLAVGGLAGWFFLNRDPKPDHNMVTVDVAGNAKDPVRPGDRVDVVGAPPAPRTPPDTRRDEPSEAAPPPVKAPPPASPPTSQAPAPTPPPTSEPKPTAPPNVSTAKPVAPKPSSAPKAPAPPDAKPPPPKPPAEPY